MYMTTLPLSVQGSSSTLGVTTVSGSTSLPTGSPGFQVELNNIGNTTIYVQWGKGAQTAAVATSYPVQAGHAKVVTVPFSADTIAAIHSGTGTQNLIITPVVGS